MLKDTDPVTLVNWICRPVPPVSKTAGGRVPPPSDMTGNAPRPAAKITAVAGTESEKSAPEAAAGMSATVQSTAATARLHGDLRGMQATLSEGIRWTTTPRDR